MSEGQKAGGPPGGYGNQQPRGPRSDFQGPSQPPQEDQRPQPAAAAEAAGRGGRGGYSRWNDNRNPPRQVTTNAL